MIMQIKDENESCLDNRTTTNSCSRWWNQQFPHQQVIYRILKSMPFRVLTIFLVVVDTALIISEIMFDYFKLFYECKHKSGDHELLVQRIEVAMEMVHYTSIGILVFFVLELGIKIYSSGREFWNIKRKKMEYFDAIIVITSLIIDVYFLVTERKRHGEHLFGIFSIRLWRFVRIVSSVAEGIRDGEEKHKRHLDKQYLFALRRLVELLVHKTQYFTDRENDNAVEEHYQFIDDQCQSALEQFNDSQEFTSSYLVSKFVDKLEGIENPAHRRVVSALLGKLSDV